MHDKRGRSIDVADEVAVSGDGGGWYVDDVGTRM